ncbi:glycosyltransferase family 39 protein [Edwardsiella piscicida]|uniref:glycosyltransferase family 39 protein n=1 Tax=Edwardsiella piscicida TaxID=1263550 RepID=UPI0029091648|nr:glycosyltransferase family 39 protein [Edwardsiella piscicida]
MTTSRWPHTAPPLPLILWLFLYAALWTCAARWLNPALPYDAVEAVNWAQSGEWGSPKNPWLVGVMMKPLLSFSTLAPDGYWYATHFIAVAFGMLGVWMLARRLSGRDDLAWLALMALNLSGIINFDILPYNDNYLLVALWPWLFFILARALDSDPPRWAWPLFALVAGLATMAKYSTLASLGALFWLTLLCAEHRRLYRQPTFWLAIALYLLLVIPNVLWLVTHEYSAFHWVRVQIRPELNLRATVALLSVFYPCLLLALLVYLCGGRLRWPSSGPLRSLLLLFLLPLALIYLWLSLYRGEPVTEWLQPFVILAIPLLCATIHELPTTPLRRLTRGLLALAPLVLLGYVLVYHLNLRDCRERWSGVKTFSAQAQKFWHQHSAAPLRLVGGGYLHQWLILYGTDRPRTIQPWAVDTPRPPNVYTPGLTLAEIRRSGVLLVGEIGMRCTREAFMPVWQYWPTLQPQIYHQTVFIAQPGAAAQPVCLAIIAPDAADSIQRDQRLH